LEKASALLWSVKEAVSSLDAHSTLWIRCNPRLSIYRVDDGYTFPVRLSGKALARFPIVQVCPYGAFVSSGEDVAFHRRLNRHIDTAVGGSMLARASAWQPHEEGLTAASPNQVDPCPAKGRSG